MRSSSVKPSPEPSTEVTILSMHGFTIDLISSLEKHRPHKDRVLIEQISV